MRRLWALIRTEFKREFSSPATLVFFLILPLLFTAAVSAGLSGMMGEGDESAPQEVKMELPVVREDRGVLSDALLDALGSVNVVAEKVELIPEDGRGLTIPADFSARLLDGNPVTLQLQVQGDDRASPAVEQAVRAAVNRLDGAVRVSQAGLEEVRDLGYLASPEEESAFFQGVLNDLMEASESPPAVTEVHWEEGVEIADSTLDMADNAEQASAGNIVTWVQITLLGAAEVLVDERMRGTLRRMLIVPASRTTILGGKLLARLMLGLLQVTILLVGGAVLFGVRWGRNPAAVALVSFSFALATVGLGMLLATVVRTRGQASSAVIGLSMAMAALGGAWYPLEVTPPLYRQIVQVLPSTWAMRAYTDLLARGADVAGVLPEAGVLLGFAVLFIVIGMLRFRRYQ